MAHPVATLLVAVLILGATAALAPRLETNFLGSSGQNTLTVRQRFPAALSLEERSERAATVEEAINGVADVEMVQTTIGTSGGAEAAFGGSDADTATFSVTTVSDADQPLPRLRKVDDADEGGRGLQLVSMLASRWGARPTVGGKVVWCELPRPRP